MCHGKSWGWVYAYGALKGMGVPAFADALRPVHLGEDFASCSHALSSALI